MVVLSQPASNLEQFSLPNTLTPTPPNNNNTRAIPAVDLTSPDAQSQLVKACEELGFFKVINHGVPTDFISRLEHESYRFFALANSDKERAGPATPFGYGNKQIGPNGDVGWLEYLLVSADSDCISQIALAIFPDNPDAFSSALGNYVAAVKRLACRILELMADGLRLQQRDAFSRLVTDTRSDSCFRLNHYPPCPSEFQPIAAGNGGKLIGFGEHTDPQIISVLRSNNTAGLEIALPDRTWLPVSPDHASFFINVGDCLQVMTNGRFKSIKHRVVAGGGGSTKRTSRVSMIFFGGPPLTEKIAPLTSLLTTEEESCLYDEFTWLEFKNAAYKSRLADNRLALFEKKKKKIIKKQQQLQQKQQQ